MIVSNLGTIEPLSHEEDGLIWKKFLSVSRSKQDILTDEQMPRKIAELGEELGLSESAIGWVSLHIRKIFFGELSLSDAEVSLGKALGASGDDSSKAKAIVEYIQHEILTIEPKPKEEDTEEGEAAQEQAPVATVRLPLLQALSKYESLGNQLVTRERIRVKSQPEPVRPSLLYWIKYYRDELGIGHHDNVQRGNFLFRSENGKHLSGEERERVNLVLKSLEENFPLEIDTERSEVIFPKFEATPPRALVPPNEVVRVPGVAPVSPPRTAPAPVNPALSFGQNNMGRSEGGVPVPASGGEISFSSKHVFPAEKKATEASGVAPHPTSVTAHQASGQTVPRANPFRIRPVSLGKEMAE